MSRDLYPSNSNIIDLRSKILPTQAPLKTKQFINELDRLSNTPQKERNRSFGTYESERWFSPRFNNEMNTSIPRRSIFTPSRLSSRRIRESTKPYWRCPQPVSTSSASNWYNTAVESIGKSSNNSSSVGNSASISKALSPNNPVSVCNVLSLDNVLYHTTTSVGNAPSVVNVPPVDENSVGNTIERRDEITIVGTVTEIHPAFTFADSITREPKCPTPPPKPKPTYQDKEVQTDSVQTVNGGLHNSASNVADKIPVVTKPFEPPTQQNSEFAPVVTAPLLSGFQFPSAPPNGGIKFGTTSTSHASNEASMVIEPPSHQNSTFAPAFVGSTINNGVAGNSLFTSVGSAPFSGGFQFNSNPINGVFQFGASASEVPNGSTFSNGLTTRNSVLSRKVLHAKRNRKH